MALDIALWPGDHWSEEEEGSVKQELWSDMRCPVCLGILFKPTVTICGHCFCESCLSNWLASTVSDEDEEEELPIASCPQCRTPLDDELLPGEYRVHILGQIIQKLPALCPNRREARALRATVAGESFLDDAHSSCSMALSLGSIRQHLEFECVAQLKPCPFVSRGCTHPRLSPTDLWFHVERYCPWRLVSCPRCEQRIFARTLDGECLGVHCKQHRCMQVFVATSDRTLVVGTWLGEFAASLHDKVTRRMDSPQATLATSQLIMSTGKVISGSGSCHSSLPLFEFGIQAETTMRLRVLERKSDDTRGPVLPTQASEN